MGFEVVLAFVAVFTYSTNAILMQQCINRGANTLTLLVYSHWIATAILLPFAWRDFGLYVNDPILLIVLISNLVWAGADYFSTHSYKYITASTSDVIGVLSTVIVTFIGIFFFGETLPELAIVGIIIIVGSIIWHCLPEKSARPNKKGVCLQLAAVLFTAGACSLDKVATYEMTPISIAFYGFLISACIFTLIKPKAILEIGDMVAKAPSFLHLVPIISSINYVAFIYALAGGYLAVTFAIQELSILIIFFAEVYILRSNFNTFHKVASCATCTLGAVLVVLS